MGVLRIMLAFAVLLSHLPPASYKFISGGLAVQSFFIVSGFYMALVLGEKYRDTRTFYSNRLLRLLPTYAVAMALSAVALFGFGLTATFSRDGFIAAYRHPATAAFLGLENLLLVGQDLLYWFKLEPGGALAFDPSGAQPTETTVIAWQALLVPQSWSLSIELLFYAAAPSLARLRTTGLAGLAAASAALRFAGHLVPVDYGLWQGRLFPTSLFLFLFGMLAHRALPRALRLPRALGWASAAALFALIATQPLLGISGEPGRWLIYVSVTAAIPLVFSVFKDVRVDRWIGDLSYPIYLCHLLVVALVLTYEPPFPVLSAFGGVLALSVLLLLCVDRPVDRWRQARAARATATATAAAAVGYERRTRSG